MKDRPLALVFKEATGLVCLKGRWYMLDTTDRRWKLITGSGDDYTEVSDDRSDWLPECFSL